MHSDLEEGEILDDEPEIGPADDWSSYSDCSRKESNNLLKGDYGKLRIDTSHLNKYPKNSVPVLKNQNVKPSAIKHNSNSMRKKRRNNKKNHQRRIKNRFNKRQTGNSSSISECSCSSCENSLRSNSRTKHGNCRRKSWKSNDNHNYCHPTKYCEKNRLSTNSPLGIHKNSYFDSFSKSATTNANNLFNKTFFNKFSKLKVGEVIKPGSIGEILLSKMPKQVPVEIVLSDTDHDGSPPRVKENALSDDENLMILRRKALDSFSKSATINLQESKQQTNEDKPEQISINLKSHNSESSEIQHEPVDMEISISDDESNAMGKKEFPIEWAYMMPPPTSNNNDGSIQIMDRWCYDQNMCVQAMQSASKDKSDDICDYHTLKSFNQNKFCNNETLEKKSGANQSTCDTFSNVNLIGGHARQYEAFMANFSEEQQPLAKDPHLNNETIKGSTSLVRGNLIEIQLQPFQPEDILIKDVSPKIIVDEEYDEDLLLATLLIDQEKRAQKRQDNTTEPKYSNASKKPIQLAKKRSKKQCSFRKKSKTISDNSESINVPSNGSGTDLSHKISSNIEYCDYNFPKVKPVVINLQSDSDSEHEQLPTCQKSSNIDQFIRNIRNSNQDKLTKSGNPLKVDSMKTPKALSFLSKSKQQHYKILKAELNNKLTAKSVLSKIMLSGKKAKQSLNTATNKAMSLKCEKKVSKFNFSMASPTISNKSDINIIKEKNQVQKSTMQNKIDYSLAESSACILLTNEQITSTTEVVSSVSNSCMTENIPRELTATNPIEDDDEFGLRKFLLESMKSKISLGNVYSNRECNATDSENKVKNDIQCDTKAEKESNDSISDNCIDSTEDRFKNKPIKLATSSEVCLTESQTETSIAHDNDNCEMESKDTLKSNLFGKKSVSELAFIPLANLTFNNSKVLQSKSSVQLTKIAEPWKESSPLAEINFSKSDFVMKEIPINIVNCEKCPGFQLKSNEALLLKNISNQNKKEKLIVSTGNIQDKTEEKGLLKYIEQEVVKERNEVFSSTQKLTEDIKQCEKFFVESKSITSLISSLKAQILQAEKKYCTKLADAEKSLGTMNSNKARLKKHINRSKELQQMGEKLGKQIVGQDYTFPPPPSNYDAQYGTIDSDINFLKKRIKLNSLETVKIDTSIIPKLVNKNAHTLKKSSTKGIVPLKEKQIFKIDKRTNAESAPKQMLQEICFTPAKSKPATRSINPESISDDDVLCPHDLLGRCNDVGCIYIHLEHHDEDSETKPIVSCKTNYIPVPALPIDEASTLILSPLKSALDKCFSSIDVKKFINPENMASLTSTIVGGCKHNSYVDTSSNITYKLKPVSVNINRLTESEIDILSKNTNTIRSRLRRRKTQTI